MKSLKLRKLIAIAVTALTITAIYPIGASAKWRHDSYGWWNTEGSSYSVGWRKIDGAWYYFDSTGYMKTGWVNDGGTWYYLQASGAMKTGWINDGDAWYFAASSGAMQTGVVKVDGKVYYLAPSGAMATGNVIINGATYTFDASGAAVGDKIPSIDKAFNGNGTATTVGTSIVDTPTATTPTATTPTADSDSENLSHNHHRSTSLSDLSDGGTHTGDYTISTTGTFGPASGTTTINGDVSIDSASATASDSISLKNMNITGNLEVNFGEGSVTLDNVTVNGVNVSNVGSNSLDVINHSKITGTLKVNDANGNAHIVIGGNATVANATILAGANFDVAAGASVQTVTSNTTAPVTLGGTGNINQLVAQNSGSITLSVASVGTFNANRGAENAHINVVGTNTVVASLNINVPISITGGNHILTASIGANNVIIDAAPKAIAVLTNSSGTVIVTGLTVAGVPNYQNNSNVIKITTIPTTTTENFQSEVEAKYAKYALIDIKDKAATGNTVTFSVDFENPVDSSVGGTTDYVTQDVLVTNAAGTDEGITYANGKYIVPTGSKVYSTVRVYRNGQIAYFTIVKTVE